MDLLLVASADVSAVIEKGNVETIRDHNPADTFDTVYVINPPTPEPGPDTLFGTFEYVYTWIPTRQGVAGTFLLLIGWVISLVKAIRIARRDDLKVVRGQGPYLSGLVAVLVQRVSGVPAIVSLHNDYDAQQKTKGRYELLDSERLSEAVERFSISNASHVFVLTSYLESYAKRHGADARSIQVFPHKIDPADFQRTAELEEIRERYDVDPTMLTLVFVGRLVDQKDPMTLLEGFRLAKETTPELQLLVVGDGELRDDLEAFVADRDVSDVTFTGFVDREDVAGIMAASDAFVLPTLFEGFGYVFVEAMSQGLPVVTTDIPHTKDIFDEESAILFEPGDETALADSLRSITDDERRAELREASERNFHRFTAATVQQQEAETFEEIARNGC